MTLGRAVAVVLLGMATDQLFKSQFMDAFIVCLGSAIAYGADSADN